MALVGVAAVGCIFLFHEHAQEQRDVEKMLVQLDLFAHQLNSLEWQTIAKRVLAPETDEQFRSISAASGDILGRLQKIDPSGKKLRTVDAVFNEYIVAMTEEFRLLRAGDIEGADKLDEKVVDPAFAALDREVDVAVVFYSRQADQSYRTAEVGATVSLLLAITLISYLLVRAGRTELLRLQTEQDALLRGMEFSQTVMESISDSVAIIDAADYRVLGCNAAFIRNFGLPENESMGKCCYELTHHLAEPCNGANNRCPLVETVRTGKHATAEHIHDTGTGEKAHVEISTSPVIDKSGKVEKVVYLVRDITERMRTEQALLESEDKFRAMAEQAMVGVYLIQDGVFRYLNPKFEEVFGYPLEEMIGKMGPKDVTLPEDWPTVLENLRKRESGEIDSIHYEFRGLTKEEKDIELEVYGSRTVFQGKPAVIGTLLDITDRKRAEKALVEQARKLEQLALFDELTGLFNRRGFLLQAGQQLKTAERLNKVALLIFTDMDGLKGINDRFGHHEGDAALKKVAAILKESFRGSDIIGRLGGDEFAVFALSADPEGEDIIVSRLKQNIARMNAGVERQYSLSVSFGVARYDVSSPCTLDELIDRADALMYARKVAKKGNFTEANHHNS